jgi:hypothetical protein
MHGAQFISRANGDFVQNQEIVAFEDFPEHGCRLLERFERDHAGRRPAPSCCERKLPAIGADVDHSAAIQ